MINEYTRKDLDFADIEKIVEGANRVDIDCGKYQIIFKKNHQYVYKGVELLYDIYHIAIYK